MACAKAKNVSIDVRDGFVLFYLSMGVGKISEHCTDSIENCLLTCRIYNGWIV